MKGDGEPEHCGLVHCALVIILVLVPQASLTKVNPNPEADCTMRPRQVWGSGGLSRPCQIRNWTNLPTRMRGRNVLASFTEDAVSQDRKQSPQAIEHGTALPSLRQTQDLELTRLWKGHAVWTFVYTCSSSTFSFSFATIVILRVILISLRSTTRQCETQVNKRSRNAHTVPGKISALIYFSHFVGTLAFCNCSAHLPNLLVELINWQRIVELPSVCGEEIIAVIVTVAFISWVSTRLCVWGTLWGQQRAMVKGTELEPHCAFGYWLCGWRAVHPFKATRFLCASVFCLNGMASMVPALYHCYKD